MKLLKSFFSTRPLTEAVALLCLAVISIFLTPVITPLLIIYIIVRLTFLLPLQKVGFITRFIILVLAISSLNTIVAFAAWALETPLHNELILAFYTLLTAGLIVLPKSGTKSARITFEKKEIFALILSLALFWLIVSPLPLQPNAMIAARIIGLGGDNISHLELVRVVDQNKGYVQDNYLKLEHTLTGKLVPYPQGWHLNVSLAKKTIESLIGSLSIQEFLYLYHVASAAGIATLAYLFMVLCLTLMEARKRGNGFAEYISTTFFAALLFTGPFFTFLTFGFQTQIAALGLMLAELLILTQITNTIDQRLQKRLFYLALVLATGVSYVWFFLLPVAFGVAIVYCVEIFNIKPKELVQRWKFIATSLLITLCSLGQVFFQVRFAPVVPTINQPGHILVANDLLLLSALLFVYVFTVYKYDVLKIRLLGQAVGVSVVFSLLVFVYQLLEVSEPRYFYHKSTWTFILLASVALSVTAGLVLSNVFQSVSKIKRNRYILSLALILALTSITTAITPKSFRQYLSQKPYGLSEELADAVITLVKSGPANAHRGVALGSCNRENDIKAMRFAVALGGHPDFDQQDIVEAQVSSPSRLNTFKAIKKQLDTELGLFVLSSDYKMQNQLTDYLGEEDSKKILFYQLERRENEKTLKDCPHHLR